MSTQGFRKEMGMGAKRQDGPREEKPEDAALAKSLALFNKAETKEIMSDFSSQGLPAHSHATSFKV